MPLVCPRDAIHVQPNVDVLKSNLHQVIEAVAVHIIDEHRLRIDVRILRAIGHLYGLVLAERYSRATIAWSRSPEAIAPPRPVLNVALVQANNVDQPIAVHVTEPDVGIAELHWQSRPWNAGCNRIIGDGRRSRASPRSVTELAVTVRI